VTLEFARPGKQGRYDWDSKTIFQLTHNDLSELCAFMFFPGKSRKWTHRAPSGGFKTLEVRSQSEAILFALSSPQDKIHIPVVPADQYFIRNMLLSRLTEIQPPLAPELQLASLKSLASAFT
jgi:hypothetical protein